MTSHLQSTLLAAGVSIFPGLCTWLVGPTATVVWMRRRWRAAERHMARTLTPREVLTRLGVVLRPAQREVRR